MRKLLKQWWQAAPGAMVAIALVVVSGTVVTGYLAQGPEPGTAMLVAAGWLLFVLAVVRLAVELDLRE